ncbi:helix-turn-helix domain-containing protein [Nonomuraea endophytica]|uniref:AraC-like DNA-binding protein n=1 Tax=Nonomuraea endophytica TaxID=714136 RepID=A0A7W7ZYS0_9ACTN|nr:AraC family transcriptional regulator [Nonomuraea endophytica]MBB5076259.1 AraC-like DNA-binding protein [Nonomuraea endophytica]
MRTLEAEVLTRPAYTDHEVHVRAPDTAAVLAFRSGRDGTGLVVLGPRTRASYLAPGDVPRCVTIRLRPGTARAALGVTMRALVDQTVLLRDLWGASADTLLNRLATRDDAEVAHRLAGALEERVRAGSAADAARADLVDAAAGLLTGAGRVPEVARELGVSERHLRNLFHDAAGMSPKRYARIHRVRSVLAGAGEEPWAELAAETGFYDQSHLSADFRALMGTPPGAFRAGRLPAPIPCGWSLL